MTKIKCLHYYVMCISAFAQAKNLSQKESYNYLNEYKGMDFLEEFYDVEHCLSLDNAIDDLTAVCKINGGKIE